MSDDSKVKVAIRVRPFNRREIELETQCVVEVNGQQVILYNPSSSSSTGTTTTASTTTSSSTPTQATTSSNNNHHHQHNSSVSSSAASNLTTPTGKQSVQGVADSNSNGNSNVHAKNRSLKCFTFDHCFWSFNEKDTHFASQEKVYNELGLPVLESAFQGYNACIFAYGQTGSGKLNEMKHFILFYFTLLLTHLTQFNHYSVIVLLLLQLQLLLVGLGQMKKNPCIFFNHLALGIKH